MCCAVRKNIVSDEPASQIFQKYCIVEILVYNSIYFGGHPSCELVWHDSISNSWDTHQIQIQIHLFMFQLQVLHLLKYIYIYIFDDGYKGDPQKALIKAASMRATLRCGAWCFWNTAYATGEVQRRVLRTSNDLKIRHRVEGNASTWDDYVSTPSII